MTGMMRHPMWDPFGILHPRCSLKVFLKSGVSMIAFARGMRPTKKSLEERARRFASDLRASVGEGGFTWELKNFDDR